MAKWLLTEEVKICVVVFTTCYKYYGLIINKLNKMTKEQLRLRMLSEDPEEAQFLDQKRKSQYEKDLKHIEREENMRYEKIEMLKAYLGEGFRLIDEDANDFILNDILGAMDEYAMNIVAGTYEYK
jgi:hypothetical protein